MLEVIGARIAASVLMQSPIGGFIRGAWGLARRVPWQVWAAIALAIAVFVGVKVHGHKVDAFGKERFKSGFEAGYAAAKEDLGKAKAEVETKGRAMAQDERKKNDAKTADLDRSVSDFVRGGAGRAACRPVAPAATDSPSGGGQAHDAVSAVPAGEGEQLIGVPVDAAAAFARQNDKALIDNASWWSWYDRYAAIIADYQRKVDDYNAKQGRKK